MKQTNKQTDQNFETFLVFQKFETDTVKKKTAA